MKPPGARAAVWRPSLEQAWVVALVVVCAVFFRTYISVTPWTTRAHDCVWHLDYIHAIRDQHRIPGPDACLECTQPPAYYVLAEAWLRVSIAGKRDTSAEGHALQVLDASLGTGAALFFVLTAYAALRSRYERRLASALIVFWPELYIESAKVGNDALLYFFAAGAQLGMVSWRRTGRSRDLILAAVFAGGAVNAKNNGYVVVATLLGSLVWAAARAPAGSRRAPPGTAPALTVVAASVGFWLFSVVHYKHGVIHPNWDGGALGAPNVTNDPSNFIPPAPWSLFDSPYIKQPCGNFWEYLLRSSLFGEWADGSRELRGYAFQLLVLGLVLCAFLVVGLATVFARALRKGWRGGYLEILLTVAGFVLFLFCFRVRYPFYFHNDFRFVLPILAPCAILVAIGCESFRKRLEPRRPSLSALPVWLVVLFCFLSTRLLFEW